MKPADPTERIELLDALRGFALFGVCLANLFIFCWWLARYRFGPMEWVWRSLT